MPKMVRPPAKSVANLNSTAAVPALAASAPETAHKAASLIEPASPALAMPAAASAPSTFAPSFSLHSPEDQFVAHYWPQIVFAVIAIVSIGCLTWGLSGPSPSTGSAASSSPHAASWSHPSVAASGRSMTMYEPSRGESDYRIEFSWVPDSSGVGWVFRSRDENNYYAARLSLQQRGSSGALVAEHFSVLGGAESAHSRRTIPLANNAGMVRVHMDATGPAFRLFLENNPADNWSDARLTSGALGFYDDGDHLPKVLALSFTFIKNQVSRTSVVSLP
ncbi:MAG: hypothetical protein ABI833_09290 [Acidobacteriota bacterium]